MKIRTDFVTNSSSSSFVFFAISSDELSRVLDKYQIGLDCSLTKTAKGLQATHEESDRDCCLDTYHHLYPPHNKKPKNLTMETALDLIISYVDEVCEQESGTLSQEISENRQRLLQDPSLDITIKFGEHLVGDAVNTDWEEEDVDLAEELDVQSGIQFHNGKTTNFYDAIPL